MNKSTLLYLHIGVAMGLVFITGYSFVCGSLSSLMLLTDLLFYVVISTVLILCYLLFQPETVPATPLAYLNTDEINYDDYVDIDLPIIADDEWEDLPRPDHYTRPLMSGTLPQD